MDRVVARPENSCFTGFYLQMAGTFKQRGKFIHLLSREGQNSLNLQCIRAGFLSNRYPGELFTCRETLIGAGTTYGDDLKTRLNAW